jgi:hypothetical protein
MLKMETTWEAEIKKMVIWSQPGQMFVRPHLNQWLGEEVHACHPQLDGDAQIVGSCSRPAWA